LTDNGKIIVACTQEAPLFAELAGEQEFGGELRFVNIRERAGWSSDTADKTAKTAALLADAAYAVPTCRLHQHVIVRPVPRLWRRPAGV
jgi:hypothetical protein